MSGSDLRATLLTPRGAGGVAVVQISGPGCVARVASWLDGPASVDATPRLRRLCAGRHAVDSALILVRRDIEAVELHLHGAEVVLQALEGLLGGPFASLPMAPVDSVLLAALGDAQLAFGLEQARLLAPFGGFAGWLAAASPADLAAAAERAAMAAALVEPRLLVLAGRKNAGKSTLMNRLLARERVLVGPVPGLTRDPVRELVELAGYPYELVDTAGEGEPLDALDAAAVAAGRRARAHADVLWVVDGSVGPHRDDSPAAAGAALVVRSKCDLTCAPWPAAARAPDLDLACADPASAPVIRAAVGAALRRARGLPPAGPVGGVVPLDAAQRTQLAEANSRRPQ